MLSGYLIVVQAANPTYYFAALKACKPLRIMGKEYCGSGRTWDYHLPNSAPETVRAVVARAEDYYSENLKYGFFDNLQSALYVTSWLNSGGGELSYEVVRVVVHRWDEQPPAIGSDSHFLGVDIDCDGCYPIKEELFAAQIASTQQSEFDDHFRLLNNGGLFSSLEEAINFVNCYLHIQNENNLEKIQMYEVYYCHLFHVNHES